MRRTITIPRNQHCKEGDMMKVIITSNVGELSVYLKARRHTSSAIYDESWTLNEFNPNVHGFGGINEDLQLLVHLLDS